MYKVAYFAMSEEVLLSSQFEQSIKLEKLEEAMKVKIASTAEEYASYFFKGDMSKLISFNQLIGVTMTQKVIETDYTKFEAKIQEAWKSLPG